MVEQFLNMIQRLGLLLRDLNEKFFFYVDIETNVSWGSIFLMWILYRLLTKYFKDTKLTTDELVKLLAIYLLILGVIIASYTDIHEILTRDHPEYTFFFVVATALGLVLILAWAGAQDNGTTKKKWILWSLYTPIILIILSNGDILEERFDSLSGLLPRSEFAFVPLPGEYSRLKIGGVVETEQRKRVEDLLKSHPDVKECAIVGSHDVDKLIKPYAFVVLSPNAMETDQLKDELKNFVRERIEKNRIPNDMEPYWIYFIEKEKLPRSTSKDKNYKLVEKILNDHRAVAGSSMVKDDKGKITAYIALNDGYEGSSRWRNLIMEYAKQEITKHNKISTYLVPRWIDFIEEDEMPRNKKKEIRYEALQKRAKKWSEIFPNNEAIENSDSAYERN